MATLTGFEPAMGGKDSAPLQSWELNEGLTRALLSRSRNDRVRLRHATCPAATSSCFSTGLVSKLTPPSLIARTLIGISPGTREEDYRQVRAQTLQTDLLVG
jgi:hypothetical protein